MAPSLLSLMRGPDGRRLGIVLAAVLVLAGFLGSIGAGMAAGLPGDGLVLCNTGSPSGDGSPAVPPAQNHLDCCLVGHGPVAATVPPVSGEVSARLVALSADPPRQANGLVAVPLALASAGPRGPPLLG